MKITNEKEILLTALARSGNHALIYWIINQITNINNGDFFARGRTEVNENPMIIPRLIPNPYPKVYRKLLIYNYEDKRIEDIFSKYFVKNRKKWVGNSKEVYNVILLRDPFNHFASRLKIQSKLKKNKIKRAKKNYKAAIKLWINHAKEFLGETQYISNDKICINYNQWFISEKYRKSICDKMHMEFNDRGKNLVPPHGLGSSFDGMSYDGKASQMNVLKRYKKFTNNNFYRSTFTKELLYYAFKIYDKKDFNLKWLTQKK
ncbi:MAG: hypothetical protein ACOC5T_01365 [Elusimicrobiota bacterium]